MHEAQIAQIEEGFLLCEPLTLSETDLFVLAFPVSATAERVGATRNDAEAHADACDAMYAVATLLATRTLLTCQRTSIECALTLARSRLEDATSEDAHMLFSAGVTQLDGYLDRIAALIVETRTSPLDA